MTPESEHPAPDVHRKVLDEALRSFKDKEESVREEIRRELALREQRLRMSELREDEEAKQRLEARLRGRLVREEEERYFAARGYVRYVNRYGQNEWVPADEAGRRKQMRRKEFIRNLFSATGRKRLRNYVLGGGLTVALLVFVYILTTNLSKAPGQAGFGSIIVQTDPPNAQIYIDGVLKEGVTPLQIGNIPEGMRTFVVVKDGFVAKPPVRAVTVTAKTRETISFELSNVPYLGKVTVETNLTVEFQLFVDGYPCPMDANRQAVVPIGFHVFTVVKAGYLVDPPYIRALVPRGDDSIRLPYHFSPERDLGTLDIQSPEPYGYVYVDGKFTGLRSNNGRIPLRPGTYEISVRKNGFRADPLKQVVDVQPNGRNRLVFALKPVAERTPVSVRTTTPGANIVLDGEMLPYLTPMPDLSISPGEHYLNLCRDGKWLQPDDLVITGASDEDDQELAYDF